MMQIVASTQIVFRTLCLDAREEYHAGRAFPTHVVAAHDWPRLDFATGCTIVRGRDFHAANCFT